MSAEEQFSADWLGLREPADHVARNLDVMARVTTWAAGFSRLTLLDLGCGTGATLRRLAPLLPEQQRWVLADQDAELLKQARLSATRYGVEAATARLDLAAGVSDNLLREADLVTGSALLDLVSDPWLDSLIAACRSLAKPIYFALTVDGRVLWSPEDPEDRRVIRLFDRHLQGDKGFGPSLGSRAVAHAAAVLTEGGWRLHQGQSDWRLSAMDAPLQAALIDGYAAAAEAMADPAQVSLIQAWRNRRHDHLRRGYSQLTVGHRDLFAIP